MRWSVWTVSCRATHTCTSQISDSFGLHDRLDRVSRGCRVPWVMDGSWMATSCGIGRNGESEHLCVASVQGALRLVPRTTKMQGPGLEEGGRHVFNVRSCGGLSGGRPLMGRAPSIVASYARGSEIFPRSVLDLTSRRVEIFTFMPFPEPWHLTSSNTLPLSGRARGRWRRSPSWNKQF